MPRPLAACLLSLTLLAATACVRTEAIYDVRDEPVPAAAQGLSRDEIGRKITEAVARARWRLDAAEPGRLRATYDIGKHAAAVNVSWTERAYSITLHSSNNLQEQGGQIHRTYNVWVRNLEREINDAFYLGQPGAAAAPPPAAVAALPGAPPPGAAPSFGDAVPFACPPPGTEIEFASGATRVFTAGDGVYCSYDSGGERKQATPFGIQRRDGVQALARLWPLKLGNRVSFSTRSGQITFNESYHVARRAMVTVKAGTFDAFVIDWSSYSTAPINPYSETGSFWYAPAVGYVVKVQHRLTSGTYPRLADDEAVRIARR